MADQRRAQAHRAVQRAAVVHLAARVHRHEAVVLPPPAGGVEVLERQADRVHDLVAARARRVFAMLLHALAHRQHGFVVHRFRQRRHVGRRQRRRSAQQHFEHVLAARHRRRAVGQRGLGQDGAPAEQPEAVRVGERHPAELRTGHVGHPVVLRQHVVHEGVVGGEQVEQAAVFTHDAVEEQLHFTPHRLRQVAREVGEDRGLRVHVRQTREPQPLRGEMRGEALGARVGQHAPDLLLEHGWRAQLPVARQLDERVVGARAPQEIREPRRQFQVVDRVMLAGREAVGHALEAEDELGTRDRGLHHRTDAGLERAFLAAQGVELHQHRDVVVGGRPAERAARQGRDDAPGAGRFLRRVVGLARQDPCAARRVRHARRSGRPDDRECLQVGQRGHAWVQTDAHVHDGLFHEPHRIFHRAIRLGDERGRHAVGTRRHDHRRAHEWPGVAFVERIDREAGHARAVDRDFQFLSLQ